MRNKILKSLLKINNLKNCITKKPGRSQNTVPIASTQVAIKGIVQYSMRTQYEDTRAQAVGQQTRSA